MQVAFIGNTGTSLGPAADLALAGHDVRIAAWTDDDAVYAGVAAKGGVEFTGEPSMTVSGKNGFAKVAAGDIATAVKGAEVVFLDFDPPDFEARFEALAPHLTAGQIVHSNTHGYWPAFRLAPKLKALGIDGVIFTESNAPTMTAMLQDGGVVSWGVRTGLPISTFPASKSDDAFARIKTLYPTVKPARNVLETNFANLNMLVHPGVHLLNVAWWDRAAETGELVSFYGSGNTVSGGLLTEALDVERQPLCAAFGVGWTSVVDYLKDFYHTTGDGFYQAVKNCGFYQNLKPHAPNLSVEWTLNDLPYAHAPLVAVAGLTGTALPLQEALLAVFKSTFQRDFKAEGLGLKELGLDGADARAVLHYAETGEH